MLLPEEEYDHFVEAQDTVWDDVLAELKAGKKESHWMWFVFPVLEGVGQSPTALFFAMGDLDETRGFAAHSVLGPRLLTCVDLLLAHEGRSAEAILGATDAYKLQNCATLFRHAVPNPAPFNLVLQTFFGGQDAERTVTLLTQAAD